jgi:hypothetical protein
MLLLLGPSEVRTKCTGAGCFSVPYSSSDMRLRDLQYTLLSSSSTKKLGLSARALRPNANACVKE